jgi:uncharacterized protein
MTAIASPLRSEQILWNRLDVPGHDACRLDPVDDGWQLSGTALFLHEGEPAHLRYKVECDERWHTRQGWAHGWIGSRKVQIDASRTTDGAWICNGARLEHLRGCLDLDLGFTPSTNLFQLRRIALAVGDALDVPVAWFDAPDGTLELMKQRYERRSEDTYWYESPQYDYYELIGVSAAGFVTRYPKLWERVQ